MFLSRKNQYCENYFTTKCDLQIQCYPYQITNSFFTELEQKIHMKTQKSMNSQSILEKEEWAGGIYLPDFTLYFNATAIKTVQYWHKKRNINQWNKIESPEINPCTYVFLIFDKGGKDIQWGRDSLFNTWCWGN